MNSKFCDAKSFQNGATITEKKTKKGFIQSAV